MKTVRTVADLRAELAEPRREGRRIGLVPTMGAFHEGHLELIRRARAENDVVVVSLFVNPTQFGPSEDLDTYPRDEERDAQLAEDLGADVLFAPPVEEVYPDGFATTVSVAGLTEVLDGDPGQRGAAHFDGVTTVVTKLFNMAQPDAAYFGQKDAQQALVIRKLVRDLDIPVRIAVVPTVRDADGLAMSSRNAYLTEEERERALGLSRALEAAEPRGGRRAQGRPIGPRGGEQGARRARDRARVPGASLCGRPVTCRPGERPDASRRSRARGTGAADRQRHSGGRPMNRTMLKSKIHRCRITDSDLHYVGSITVDEDLLDAADIREHEQVHVVDVDNGARFETYTIAGQRGSGEIKVNGAAARLVHTGDTVIVISYASYDEAELESYEPKVVHVNADNSIITVDDAVAELLS